MDLLEAIQQRHSVRQYKDKPLEADIIAALQKEIACCNQKSGLHIQLVTDEPKAFDSFMGHYGKFSKVNNYIALVGNNDGSLEEKCGYCGQHLVLKAQQLGLNTCWVALTYSKIKTAFTIDKKEKLCAVIALGYGQTAGVAHKSKTVEQVAEITDNTPEWFINGVKAALLAPTAMNQQKFFFTLKDDEVSVKAGNGFYTKVDLGIVKYHFEIGAQPHNFIWG
ncbi:MAG: nitroreductase family protein [Erysipelotrichaceae bacterium]